MQKDSKLFSSHAVGAIPWMISGKVLSLFTYFAANVLIVRRLSSELFGAYSFFIVFAETLMLIAQLGLHQSLLRYIPEYMQQKEYGRVKKTILFAFSLELIWSLIIVASLILLSSQLERYFHMPFQTEGFLIGSVLIGLLFKDFFTALSTAFFLSKLLTWTTCFQGLILLFFAALLPATISSMLLAQAFSLLLFSFITYVRLRGQISCTGKTHLLEKKRLFSFSLSSFFNGFINRFAAQYSEVFFLGLFCSAEWVGYYSLGFSQSFLLMTLIPLSLHSLFTSACAESLKKESFGRMIRTLFSLLLILLVPVAFFSFFFAEQVFVIIFGQKMRMGGMIAGNLSLLHLLGLFSFPLSLAIITKEQVHRTLPLQCLHIGVNVALNLLLTAQYGVTGAYMAIGGSFLLILPYRLYIVKKIIGGIFFPFFLFLRVGVFAFVLSFAFYKCVEMASMVSFFAYTLAFVLSFIMSLPLLLTDEEKEDIAALGVFPWYRKSPIS